MRATHRVIAVVIAVAAGCGSSASSPDARTGEPTLAAIRAEIFTGTCGLGTCHAAPTRAAKLDLRDGSDDSLCQQLVAHTSCLFGDKLLVVPGKPEVSFLLDKLRGTGLTGTPDPSCATTNDPMPMGLTPLSATQIAQVEQWIRLGARCGEGPAVDAGVADAAIDSRDDGLADIATFTAVATTIRVGETTPATVTLTRGAASAGQTLILDPEDVALLGVPNALTFASGETTKTFDVLGKQPAALTSLTASSGTNSKTLTFTVLAP